jgi:hypothetical protein
MNFIISEQDEEMSDFTEKHNKIAVRLQELYKRHRALDTEIKVLYNERQDELIINRKKTHKLFLKDEIHKLESELKDL